VRQAHTLRPTEHATELALATQVQLEVSSMHTPAPLISTAQIGCRYTLYRRPASSCNFQARAQCSFKFPFHICLQWALPAVTPLSLWRRRSHPHRSRTSLHSTEDGPQSNKSVEALWNTQGPWPEGICAHM
jgi:hypothetical protein